MKWRRFESTGLPDPGDLESLLRVLGHRDANRRADAAAELVTLRDPAAFEPLVAALEDQSPVVRRLAVRAVGRLGGSPAIEALTGSLERDSDGGVRVEAIAALARLGAPEPVLEALRTLDWRERRAAVCALGWLRCEGAVPGLIETLDDLDQDVRARAAEALDG